MSELPPVSRKARVGAALLAEALASDPAGDASPARALAERFFGRPTGAPSLPKHERARALLSAIGNGMHEK